MPYRIYQFGSTPLPPAMTEEELGTGTVDSGLNQSVGGVYDIWGGARRLPLRQNIRYRGSFEITDSGRFETAATIYLVDHLGRFVVDHVGRRIVADTAQMALRRNTDAVKRQVGVRLPLYRKREADSAISWKLVRLLRVEHERTIEDADAVARLELEFETAQAAWRSGAQSTYTATLPAGLSIQSNSDIPISDAILTVTASGTITQVTVAAPGVSLIWGGSMAASQSLVIDSGAQTVRLDGADAYNSLSRGDGHTASGLLVVQSGASVVMVTADGPGVATLSFYEQYL